MTKTIKKLKKSLRPVISPNSSGKLLTTRPSTLTVLPKLIQTVYGLLSYGGPANLKLEVGSIFRSVSSSGSVKS